MKYPIAFGWTITVVYLLLLLIASPAISTAMHPEIARAQREHEAAHLANERRRAAAEQKHRRDHEANERRRLAFDKAHPEIVAKRKRDEERRGREESARAAAAVASAAAAAERQRVADVRAAERAAENTPSLENCNKANDLERQAAFSLNGDHYQRTYDLVMRGLSVNENCSSDNDRLVNKGYFMSFKGMSEHHLSGGDSETDLNEANQLLVECQTTPGIYGTHTAAQCETQEKNNISIQQDWDLNR